MVNDRILELRKEIDKIDDELVGLIKKRIIFGKKIVDIKINFGLDKEDLKRERDIVKRLKKIYDSPLIDEIYFSIFKEVKS